MYVAHDVFVLPENKDTKIWRYMDITKFLSLLDLEQLYFTRIDKFNDPFEGALPRPFIERLSSVVVPAFGSLRKHHAVNCWHMNDYESDAMWKLYLKSDEGIAVQSTVRRFTNCFTCEEKVFVGRVNYIDYKRDNLEHYYNSFAPIITKRKSFEHERELRAVIYRSPEPGADGLMHTDSESIQHGVNISIDLEKLVENVFVAPNTPNWIVDLLRSVIEQYGKSFKIERSALEELPPC